MLRVVEGFIEVPAGAKLSITNGKAQLMAHVLDPRPDVNGKKSEVGEYAVVARVGVSRPVAGFKKGETFGLAGHVIPKGLRHRVEIVSGRPWDYVPASPEAGDPGLDPGLLSSGVKAPEADAKAPDMAELERLTAPETSFAAPASGKRSRR